MHAGLDSRQQRLRLSDLGHFWRRRKALERGFENSVRLGGAADRLVEFGKRESGAQAEAARALLARDGKRGSEGFLSRISVGRITFQKSFTTSATQLRFERAIADPVDRRERFVQDRNGAIGVARLGFSLGQCDLDDPVEDQSVLLAQALGAAAHGYEFLRRARRHRRSPSL